MRIFNIGIREVILLLVIMLILFGPKRMQENARSTAAAIRRLLHSDTWRSILGFVGDVNTLRDQVYEESGIREIQDSLRGIDRQFNQTDQSLKETLRENTAPAAEQTPHE